MDSYKIKDRLPNGCRLLLASASPRRRELLSAMGLSFSVVCADVSEDVTPGTPPAEATRLLAARKARAAAAVYAAEGDLLIGADTLVACEGRALGKPENAEEAQAMLMQLSGRTHYVHTGVAVIYRGRIWTGVDSTAVTMRAFDTAEAAAYVATGEPMDKAGSYGIQGLGGQLVAGIAGAYDTVVGLPTRLVDDLLCRALAGKEGGEAL